MRLHQANDQTKHNTFKVSINDTKYDKDINTHRSRTLKLTY